MENKEIYIDGVDVAGCKDYREVEYKEMPICMNYYNHLPKPSKETEWQYCAGNKNCHYKQLKRLKQENERLKKGVQLFKCLDTFGESECHCACRCLGNEFCEDADKKINSYRSALEKIKDLCIHYKNTNDKCITNCYAHFIVTDLIQDKINEVLQ